MKILLTMLFCVSAVSSFGQDMSRVRKEHYNLDNGLAIQGYDPVAYFSQQKAVKGDKSITTSYEGITYRFSSEQNRTAFKKSPSTYEPQYGGWCAYAMGNDGSKVEVDPETFKIVDGKLFLFYNRLFTNTLKSWNKAELKLKQQADLNWTKIFH